MKGKNFFFIAFAMIPALTYGQAAGPDKNNERIERLDSVVVSAYRADSRTPVAHTTVTRDALKAVEPDASLPMALSLQPSVVTMTEGGTGFGYSRMRVRGSDGTRINVTLNGVTLNDAESQEVFWVNIPSLTSMLQSVQLQRGLGTSVNGPGAFGASVNMQTLAAGSEPYGRFEAGYGSYNSFSVLAGAGTGRLKNGLFFDADFSYNRTDGYIRNAWGRVGSALIQTGWMGRNDIVKLVYILGKQHTGITWNGVPKDSLATNRTYNSAGEYFDDQGNRRYYGNESDNYTQHHLQLFYSHEFNENLFISTTLHYTRGTGFYEQYKYNKKFSSYGLSSQTVGGTTYKKSDFITRKKMDNEFLSFSLNVDRLFEGGKWTSGLNASTYNGLHFGRIAWSKYNENIADDYEWYSNTGLKRELNFFSRVEKAVYDSRLNLYADLQARRISYDMCGTDSDIADMKYSRKYFFFNPKAGLSFDLSRFSSVYASVSLGHKEASRDDIKESIKSNQGDSIRPERMIDFELGYRLSTSKYAVGINFYDMEYKDQLVATGKLSESGYTIKENVARSFRRGVEVTAAASITPRLRAEANVTLSMNKILGYSCYVDTYDNDSDWNSLPQTREYYPKTDLILSPSVVGMAMLTYSPLQGLDISANLKHVGKQYYDNTSSSDRMLDPYSVLNAAASYSLNFKGKGAFGKSSLKMSIFANNLLGEKYCSEAWVYRALFKESGTSYVEDGFFPQAGRYFSFKCTYSF
jgi:iron complex outermembrane receptor protein